MDKNNDYHLKYSDREILLSESTWLKDNLMASAQNSFANHLVIWHHGSSF